MTIIPLSEGSFTIDSSKEFIPFNKDRDDLQARATGSLLVEIQPFIIKTENEIILIDTGLGFVQVNGKLQIHNNLAAQGISPDDVSLVLLSHLHKDHSSGISHIDPQSKTKKLSFPKAKYYINNDEYILANSQTSSSYITGAFDILENNQQVVFTRDEGVINELVTYKVTGGHSPHHQAFWLMEKDEIIFFGGDVAPQLQQMKSRFIAKYDFDGRKCMELRQEWWKQGKEEHWNFLFYHDIKSPSVLQ